MDTTIGVYMRVGSGPECLVGTIEIASAEVQAAMSSDRVGELLADALSAAAAELRGQAGE
ncbi:hypothetical protein AB0C02_30425 [Micromonospora sp. NPDC048999]|uniref:hypothetical protein n=1 Tax=Micromonospora sp. NPDC048999 TaxID=3155391 RepID=UPI0033CC41C0